MTDPHPITVFLRARLADDERVASLAQGGPWDDSETDETYPGGMEVRSDAHSRGTVCTVVFRADRDHIVRHDPVRVAADVAAKRALLDLHPTNEQKPYRAQLHIDRAHLDSGGWYHPPDPFYCDCQLDDGMITGKEPCPTKRILAAPYADHPDYDPRWSPA